MHSRKKLSSRLYCSCKIEDIVCWFIKNENGNQNRLSFKLLTVFKNHFNFKNNNESYFIRLVLYNYIICKIIKIQNKNSRKKDLNLTSKLLLKICKQGEADMCTMNGCVEFHRNQNRALEWEQIFSNFLETKYMWFRWFSTSIKLCTVPYIAGGLLHYVYQENYKIIAMSFKI